MWNADTGVTDLEKNCHKVIQFSLKLSIDGNFAFMRKLYSVANQIVENLTDSPRISYKTCLYGRIMPVFKL